MADAQVFSISAKSAKGYNFLPGRMPDFHRNGAGVTAIMGLSNGRGAAARAKAQGDNEMFEDYDFGEEEGYEPNARRRRRRRKTAGKRRRVSRTRARARRTTRRSRRRVASRTRRGTRRTRRSLRRRSSRGRRRVARGRRRVSRGRRRVSRGRRMVRRVSRGRRRGYRRNGYMENSDFMDNADVGSWGSIGGDFDRVSPKGKKIKYVSGSTPFGASPVQTKKGKMIRGFSHGLPKHKKVIYVAAGGRSKWQPPAWDFPWDPAPQPKEKKPKYPAEVRDYLRAGIKPKHLFKAMEDMTREQIDTIFPDYRAYRRFMRHATRDRKFRRYRSRYFSSARYGSARSRTNKIARRIAAKLVRKAKGRRRKGRRYSGSWRRRVRFLKKAYGRKSYRRRPRYMGWSRKGKKSRGRKNRYRNRFPYAFRPNFDGGMFDFAPNVPYSDTKELLLAGLCAVGGYAVPQLLGGLLSKYVHPYAGAAGAVVAGGATVYLSKHIDNDAYAKGAAIGGLLGKIGRAHV